MAGVVDFVFLIDGTGSMKPCMDALKENISIFLDALVDPQNPKPVTDWRGKVVTYRDQQVDGERWFEDNEFVSNDVDALKAQLNKLEAAGGGDEPESALDALHKIATMGVGSIEDVQEVPRNGWRNTGGRVLILFTDASFHPTITYDAAKGGLVKDIEHAFTTHRIASFIFAPDLECWEDLSAIDKLEYEPIKGVGDEDSKSYFVKGLEEFVTGEKFIKVLDTLGKSASQLSDVVEL